jgi:predicted DNA-binding protein
MTDKEPVRINTRISHKANEWLDKRSKETSISKSALINIAIENYRKETEVVDMMPEIKKKLEELGISL